MKRLGKNELSIIMEGNVGKVMKGGKLLERVRFERGDNLVEAVERLKKEYLLEGLGKLFRTSDFIKYGTNDGTVYRLENQSKVDVLPLFKGSSENPNILEELLDIELIGSYDVEGGNPDDYMIS